MRIALASGMKMPKWAAALFWLGAGAILARASIPTGPSSAAEITTKIRAEILNVEREQKEGPLREASLARLYFYLGENASEEAEKARSYQAGLEHARSAHKTAPGLGAALLWQVANQGAIARAKPLEAERLLPQLEKDLLEARRLDPACDHAAADRMLGHLYATLPAIDSTRRASDAYRAALKRFPEYPGNQAYFARFLVEAQGECVEARKLARAVLREDAGLAAANPYEASQWLDMARFVMRRTDGRCGP